MPDDNVSAPSLLDKEATGGEIAEKGFAFQDRILLTLIAEWLSRPGFSRMIREAYADTEAEFFVPGYGVIKEFIECKDHKLAPTEFWTEIERFRRFDLESTGSYKWFRLVCTGLSEDLQPLKNGLRRVRDPYEFYRDDETLIQASFEAYVQVVIKLGKSEKIAKFVFEKVRIEDEHVTGITHTEASFKEALPRALPEYDGLTSGELSRIYTSLLAYIGSQINTPISRTEIIRALHREIAPARVPALGAIKVYTATDSGGEREVLRLEWAAFSGKGSRTYPSADEWNSGVVDILTLTRNWIAETYPQRRIQVSGQRRLSAAIAIGAVFSATSGFALDILYRDNGVLSTDDHAPANHVIADIEIDRTYVVATQLVVSVGICNDIRDTVLRAIPVLELEAPAVLGVYVPWAIATGADANALVARLKNEIRTLLKTTGATELHLFYNGPSYFAMLLGHRLNATASIQCYEWVGGDLYVPTCRLLA